MLVAFAVENYTCFRDRQELSAEAVTKASHLHAFESGCPLAPRLNRVTAVYGPNGSGKSRLLQALLLARDFVVHSAQGGQGGETLPYSPFLFDIRTRTSPTTFEVRFIEEGSCYELRFSMDRERIHAESLLVWPPKGRKRRLLERRWDTGRSEYEWTFGPSVSGPKEMWRRSTRPNALAVSVAAQLNSDTFMPVVRWFQRLAGIVTDDFPDQFTAKAIMEDESRKRSVMDLLQAADIALEDVAIRKETQSVEALREGLPPSVLKGLARTGVKSLEFFRTKLAHRVQGTDELHYLDLEEESDGTQRVFALALPWIDILEHDRVVVIDELDRSLHPLLLQSLVRRINSGDPGERLCRAQLVATLHDTSLLGGALNRGQVWFTDKDRPSEAATLAPLSDFHPRKGEALERGYLAGRYGGVPIPAVPQIIPAG